MASLERIHITGGPGSGKTTLAKRIADRLGVPFIDLDGLALGVIAGLDVPAPEAVVAACRLRVEEIAASPTWVSEGSYFSWTEALFDRATLIVWLDVPWSVASYRILSRHAKASIRRNNRFPGTRRLYNFWRWSGRYYANRNPAGLNPWGNPSNRDDVVSRLVPYESKLFLCHTRHQTRELINLITSRELV